MTKSLLFLLFFYGCLEVPGSAQEKLNIKFGKISPADFEVNSPLIDSNVNAIVLADIGSTEFTGNNKGWFSMIFKKHKRIKILNTKGFDAAEVSIYLYATSLIDAEKLNDLSANTYNLENGAVVTTKLDNKSIFEDKLKGNTLEKKFTFPAIKPGSIIEFTYSISSDFFFNLQSWSFQDKYPCIWSEYNIGIPDFFNYVFLSQGYLPFDINKKNEGFKSYDVRETVGFGPSDVIHLNTTLHERKWVIKNVPPLKEESFTSTINNHLSKIEFQLSEYRFPQQPVKKVMGDWSNVRERLMDSDDFGLAYNQNNGWLTDDLKKIKNGSSDLLEMAKRIFQYVRDNFTCTGTYGYRLGDNTSLKDVYKRKSGSVSEINLLLLAMLKHESIDAEPVLLSLRSRGVVHPVYPLMNRFNYLICEVSIGDQKIYLDASKPMMGFNKLPASCYNGIAWVINKTAPAPIYFFADSLEERKVTTVFIINDDKEGSVGAMKSQLGYFESTQLREKMVNTSKESYVKEIKKDMGDEMKIENLEIDSLKLYDEPVSINFDFKMKNEEDMIYFNPMFGEGINKNPFTSAKRFYPVEMPYTINETFVLDMEIPKGYVVDEIPKSVRFKLNENEGLFEYLIVKSAEKVQLRTSVKIKKANFAQDDYDSLREFFAFVIKKQGEQIVFKKNK